MSKIISQAKKEEILAGIEAAHKQDSEYCKKVFNLGSSAQHYDRVMRYSSLLVRGAGKAKAIELYMGSAYDLPRWRVLEALDTLTEEALEAGIKEAKRIEDHNLAWANKMAEQRAKELAEYESNTIAPGKAIRVVGGRKVAKGTEGVVISYRISPYGAIKAKDSDGNEFWTYDRNVELIK